ncbi:MAG: glutathione S-transferase family protein [Alphaproteobacteria bacterium]|jgi:glutathione S-transferase|nr:glutathione S-transferase family protein [Alphaproteobacteria bacterium]MDP6565628.1 glutathione S-transferase family protein [Alphaproteobacteria bacterium]MDP6813243.1 glutathione S-transferase family protein [Alphaproteobacteria bacterium]
MSTITICGSPLSTYVRTARMAAIEKGIGHELRDMAPGSDEIRALHPFGKIPVLRHGDLVLYETLAIVGYIDQAFDGPPLQPADPVGRARTN